MMSTDEAQHKCSPIYFGRDAPPPCLNISFEKALPYQIVVLSNPTQAELRSDPCLGLEGRPYDHYMAYCIIIIPLFWPLGGQLSLEEKRTLRITLLLYPLPPQHLPRRKSTAQQKKGAKARDLLPVQGLYEKYRDSTG